MERREVIKKIQREIDEVRRAVLASYKWDVQHYREDAAAVAAEPWRQDAMMYLRGACAEARNILRLLRHQRRRVELHN